MSEENRPIRNRGSFVGPLILIGLGLVFLLSNIGAIKGDAWNIILRLWPLLLVAMGLDGILRRQGMVGGALMLGLGVILLLSNYGYLNMNVWQLILQLWPLLLIAIGFDIVIGRRSLVGSLIGLVLILAVLAGALWLGGVTVDRGMALNSTEVQQMLEGATSARVVIEPGAGALALKALDDSNTLLSGTVGQRRGEQISQDFSQANGRATFILRSSGSTIFLPQDQNRWKWDLGLNRQIPLDLKVGLGAGEAVLDLTGLDLSALEVDLGVGQSTITLPATGRFEAKVNGAIGQLVIIVPQGMAVRIHANTALGGLDVPDRYNQNNDVYTSPGYESADHRIELDISQAIGEIVIR